MKLEYFNRLATVISAMAGEPSIQMDQRYTGGDTVTKSDEDAMDLLPVTAEEVQGLQDKAEDLDLDAEGEDDDADADADADADSDPDADIDAEGEEDEEPVLPIRRALKVAEEEDGGEDAEVETPSEAHPESESENNSDTNTDTEVENEWEAESDTAAEVEAEIVDPNRCMSVFPILHCLENKLIEWLDSVAETKNMIRAKNLKNISHARSVEITVCFLIPFRGLHFIFLKWTPG